MAGGQRVETTPSDFFCVVIPKSLPNQCNLLRNDWVSPKMCSFRRELDENTAPLQTRSDIGAQIKAQTGTFPPES